MTLKAHRVDFWFWFLLLMIVLGIFTFFMVKMVPAYVEIFKGIDIELPRSTKILISISDFFSNPINLTIMGALAVAGVVGFMRFRSSLTNRRARVVTNLVEPIMIICIALGVGFLLLAVLSAMFTMTDSIK